jgi:hypothetical protein
VKGQRRAEDHPVKVQRTRRRTVNASSTGSSPREVVALGVAHAELLQGCMTGFGELVDRLQRGFHRTELLVSYDRKQRDEHKPRAIELSL